MRILLVEDEESFRRLLEINLESAGYAVISAADGFRAIELFQEQSFDLIILDVMLPGRSGLEVCREIRMQDQQVPILFLTARDGASDRIEGLKRGGDDYLTKPFVLEELLLRVSNLLKRSGQTRVLAGEFVFGDNRFNPNNYEAIAKGKSIQLTKMEARLLRMLIEHKNEVVSRKQILSEVWGYDVLPSTRSIDNFILNFRKYFEEDPRNPAHFLSIRGVGYMFRMSDPA